MNFLTAQSEYLYLIKIGCKSSWASRYIKTNFFLYTYVENINDLSQNLILNVQYFMFSDTDNTSRCFVQTSKLSISLDNVIKTLEKYTQMGFEHLFKEDFDEGKFFIYQHFRHYQGLWMRVSQFLVISFLIRQGLPQNVGGSFYNTSGFATTHVVVSIRHPITY